MAVVLMVDDIEASRQIYRVILEHHGHVVHEAGDGLAAVRQAEAIMPDLVILDLRMPVMNGYDAFDRMRGNPATSGIPVIALTSHDETKARVRAAAAGFDGFLAKPASEREVISAMDALLRRETSR